MEGDGVGVCCGVVVPPAFIFGSPRIGGVGGMSIGEETLELVGACSSYTPHTVAVGVLVIRVPRAVIGGIGARSAAGETWDA